MKKNKSKIKKSFSITLAALLAFSSLGLGGFLGSVGVAEAALGDAGLVDLSNGFPRWYQDENGLALELCGDSNDILCLADPVVAGNEFSEAIGFGEEAFWWNAEAQTNVPPSGNTIINDKGEEVQILPNGGKALLVLAMEAAWANEEPADGDQLSFGRVRIRIDVSEAGIYTIVHPFGKAIFEVTPERLAQTSGIRAIDADKIEPIETNVPLGDVGCEVVPCDFSLALESGVGPFLVWDEAVDPVAPEGYIGDPAVLHKVKGGINSNKFRVEGPNIGGEGVDFIETDLFSVSGKIADITPPVFKKIEAVPDSVEANGEDFFTVSVGIEDDLSGVREVFVDLSELGGPNKTDFGLESGTLLEGVWSGRVSSEIVGEFIIPITAVDGVGNESGSNIFLTFTEQEESLLPLVEIFLVHNNPTFVKVGGEFVDFGAIAFDVEGMFLDTAVVENTVDTTTIGTYKVVYSATDSLGNTAFALRTVYVIEGDVNPLLPNIFPNQDNPVTIEINSDYQDVGVSTAFDVLGQDLTALVQTEGLPLDTTTTGTKFVFYSVTDGAGRTSTVLREVNVVEGQEEQEKSNLTLIFNTPDEWVLFSAPNILSSINFIEEDIDAILAYDAFSAQFTPVLSENDPALLNPLNAFFVKPNKETVVEFSFAEIESPQIVLKELNSGWNLLSVNSIGLAKDEFSQLQTMPARPFGAITFFAPQTYNSRKNIFADWGADANKDLNMSPIVGLPSKNVNPNDGYWVFVDAPGEFSKPL